MNVLLRRIYIATATTIIATVTNATSLDAMVLNNTEFEIDDVIEEELPAPKVYSPPNFDFLDCHGKPFNTKELSEQEPTDIEVSCSVQGIINTKFNYEPNSIIQKSAVELSVSEKEYVMENLGAVDPKAVFAYFVYLTTTSRPEYNFLLESGTK